MVIWNPWHGCKKISPGCQNCYVYRRDSQFGKDSSTVVKTQNFSLPIQTDKTGEYRLQDTEEAVYTCMTSDFFLPEADLWREEAWRMIRQRDDLHFVIITKRIYRFQECIPDDWEDGYDNVTIICTCENQEQADARLPVFLNCPIKHREIIEEPLLEKIHIESYLSGGKIQAVTCGGESGENARLCDYGWILETRRQCMAYEVAFHFKQTGAQFRKDGKTYRIRRALQISQAQRAGIDYEPDKRERSPLLIMSIEDILSRLSRSSFRSRFQLSLEEIAYIQSKGMETIRSHAEDFVRQRLAPARIPNDGKQTPMRGHPVFIAQHATATCCRGCLKKWHDIPKGRELTDKEQEYVVSIIMNWLYRQIKM